MLRRFDVTSPLVTFRRRACAMLVAGALAPVLATAETGREMVPEFNGYLELTDRARVFLLADATRVTQDHIVNGEVGIHLDYTLLPILRRELRYANWERARYLWLRVGYARLENVEGDAGAAPENRWILEGTVRAEFPSDVWLVSRLRLDARDIGGEHSRRYRYRIHVEREFTTSSGLPFVPYAEAEFFYDTRFDAWSRRVFQGGVEVELNKSWRIEPYYAYEKNTQAGGENVNRFGLILKYYR